MLGEALTALAMTASTQLVTAMVGDGWAETRTRVARLLGGGEPAEEARQEARLDRSRDEVVAAAASDGDRVRGHHAAAWRVRFEDLLEDAPEAAEGLRELVEFLDPDGTRAAGGNVVNVQAVASGQAQQAVLGQGQQSNTFGAPPPAPPALPVPPVIPPRPSVPPPAPPT